jgi:cobalt/nickel transport protein
MRFTLHLVLVLAQLALAVTTAPAHFNMLLPERASAKRGEPVTIIYQWGHPFEHQLFDTPAPERVLAIAPDGKKLDLTKSLEKVTLVGGEGRKVTGYRLRFTPEQRGDYVFILNTPPVWMQEDEEFLQDTVKVVLHVLTQKGWDAAQGQGLDLVPLTRPYGLQPGMVFQAEVLDASKPLARSLVEIERYNRSVPKALPPDEHITRTARTDANGVVTTTLTEPGWWGLTVERDAGTRDHQGKAYPLRRRCTFWVHVDEIPAK